MLTIRKEQMAVLEAHLARRFHAFLRQHVRRDLEIAEKSLSDSDLGELIKTAITRASAYEVTAERAVAMFLDLMLIKGRDFDRDPQLSWARKILDSKDVDGTAKMQRIYLRLEAFDNRKPLPEETG